jgi:hypothetical protein
MVGTRLSAGCGSIRFSDYAIKVAATSDNRNVFRVIRRRQQRDVGTFAEVPSCGGRVMLGDNRSPAVAFEWLHITVNVQTCR